jgi:glutathione S-transferase
VLEPGIWGRPRDLEALARVVREDVPPVLDYLEGVLPASGFLFGASGLGVADIAVAAPFRNFAFARQRVDATRWPVTASFVDRVLASPACTKLQPFEERQVRTPIAEQRAVLAAMGAPLTAESRASGTPRPGVMTSLSHQRSRSQAG